MKKKLQKNGLLYSLIASVIIATVLAVLLVFTYVRQNNVAKYLDENYSLLVDWNKGEVSKDPDAVDVPKVEYKGLKNRIRRHHRVIMLVHLMIIINLTLRIPMSGLLF